MGGVGPNLPTEEYFKDGLWGHDGTQWRKLSLLWGYSDRLAAVATHTKVGAGDYTLEVLTVPSGYVYVVNAIISNDANSAIQHQHQLYAGAAGYSVHVETATGAGQLIVHSPVNYVLKSGDGVKVYFISANNGDLLVGRVWGYSMVVA